MKLVNLKEFLELPAGTLFCKYEPHFLSELMIKEDTLPPRDFLYEEVVPLEEEFPYKIDIESSSSRDGCFKDEQIFAVLSREDVFSIIQRLQETVVYL